MFKGSYYNNHKESLSIGTYVGNSVKKSRLCELNLTVTYLHNLSNVSICRLPDFVVNQPLQKSFNLETSIEMRSNPIQPTRILLFALQSTRLWRGRLQRRFNNGTAAGLFGLKVGRHVRRLDVHLVVLDFVWEVGRNVADHFELAAFGRHAASVVAVADDGRKWALVVLIRWKCVTHDDAANWQNRVRKKIKVKNNGLTNLGR